MVWRNTPNVQFNDWMISVQWRNVGRMPAMIQHFQYRFTDIEDFPTVPNYSQMLEFDTVPSLTPGDDFETQKVGVGGGCLKPDGTPITFVFWGRLIYAEMNGKTRYSGFAFQLAPMGNLSLEYGGEPYNYYT